MKSTHFLLISLLALTACRQQTHDPLRTALLKSLDNSKAFIEQANLTVYHAMENKEADPHTHERAVLWRPKALAVQRISHDLIEYIDDLQTQPGKIAGKELFQKLLNYKKALKDSLSPANFPDSPSLRESVQSDRPAIREIIDSAARLPAGLSEVDRTLLSSIRNDVLILENNLIRYLFKHMEFTFCGFTVQRGLIAINSSYFKRGQPLIVTAGLGGFEVLRQQRVTINGQEAKLAEDNVAQYITTANGHSGKHTIPVQIEYTRPDGFTSTISKNIEYEIAP